MADSKERRIILRPSSRPSLPKTGRSPRRAGKGPQKDYEETAAQKTHLLEQAQTASLEELVQVLSENKRLLKEKEKEAAKANAVLKKRQQPLEGAKAAGPLCLLRSGLCAPQSP